MELLILYYSGTGNTKFACEVAKLAAERMGHEVTMRTYEEAGELTLSDYDAYCFAAPLQAWQPTRNVERYIKSMPRLDGKYALAAGRRPRLVGSVRCSGCLCAECQSGHAAGTTRRLELDGRCPAVSVSSL